ncbi:C40 family peptidase [Dactylosporangium roseum]|uniref:C40 family peptidase n=1 Tax=Dactylosporangium roseum TaxID=47989 RepID=A0ABY5ZD86_9ACTN|nr:C40 family peptidase [Dactylosporangium roseum]UWZ38940.1 C40 family peptidase [Dactylosporangium roseum]
MTEATVTVAVATLVAAPEKVRPADAAALDDRPGIGAWIAAMTPAEQTDSDVVTQLLFGERVLVDEVRPDGWARVVATGQPAPGLDPRGYPGWIRAAHLAERFPTGGGAPLVVDALSTALAHSPGGPSAVSGVVLGTLLTPAGAAVDGWLPVHAAGHADPLWARTDHLAPVPAGPPTGDEVLAMARRLLGAVYVWGGLSNLGIDCSGLVHLVWRRLGTALPRDAHDQSAATAVVPRGEERPGDLYFFARPGRRIHHVGIVAEAGRMVHASSVAHRVVEEAMPPERAETLVGAHRV